MSEGIVAKRYAQAFFELTKEKGLLQQVENDLRDIVCLTEEVGELRRLLAHRGIPAEEKKDLLRRVFQAQVQPQTMNFLLLLCDRRREAILPAIFQHFQALYLDAQGIAEVEVRSAVPLTDDQVQSLVERLHQVTGREIRLHQRLAPELLGGLVVKVGDLVFDGSIAQRLSKLKEHIMSLDLEGIRGVRLDESSS